MNKPTSNTQNIADLIKEVLAGQIGVEPEDIHGDDLFAEDLHMSAADLTDFVSVLGDRGIDTTKIDFVALDTVDNLVELLSSEELID